jgi:hypothetical protein
MGKFEKLYEHILMRRSDANVPFETLRALLRRLGFDERIKAITTFSPRIVLKRSSTCNPKVGRGNRTRSNKSGM